VVINRKLYTHQEVGLIIKDVVQEIAERLGKIPSDSPEEKQKIMRQWATEMLPSVEAAVAEEVVRRHVQGVILSVWAGPPGSGKGTNIDAVGILGKVYAEVTSQGVARVLEEPYHSMLLKYSTDQTIISTGTKGMFNKPEGEYAELFNDLVPVVGKLVADGGFVPDDLVSVFVELMILYRLTQNYHKIQIDLWPRTIPQFSSFTSLIETITKEKGKVSREVVIIKVLRPESLRIIEGNLEISVSESIKIADKIREILESSWYKEEQKRTVLINDSLERFQEEKKSLAEFFLLIAKEFSSEIDKAILEELRNICDRLAFRFELIVSKSGTPRPDEFPLSVIRRLSVYTGETSPAFMGETAKHGTEKGYYVISSAATPEEVVSSLLETIAGKAREEKRWQEIKKIAGEIAVAIVNRKELIVDTLVQRVGGILSS
jgi:adenylate kinase family enzyme